MSIQLVIVVIYVALLFGISIYVKHRADKGSTAYLLAGRKLGSWLVGVSVTGLAVGAASTIGVAENAYKVGLAAGWYNGAWSIGAIFMGLVAAGKLRAMKVSTVPEFFEKYYDLKGRVVGAVCLLIVMCCITSLQYLAGGAILSSLLPDIFTFTSGMIASAVVFIGITLIGGLWSSGLSNILSVALIYGGVIFCCLTSTAQYGGLDAVVSRLPQNLDWMSPFAGVPGLVILAWIVVMMTQTITAQGPVQIACGASSSKTARNGFIIGGLLIFPIGFLCAILGIVARAQFPDITPTMALPTVIMHLNPFASGVTLAAMWAADVSTACTILLGAGTLFSADIYKRFINPGITDEKFVSINRLAIFGTGLVTLWFAFNAVGIVKTMIAGLSMTTALTCVFLFTMFAPGLCRRSSAFWCSVVGLAGIILWRVVPALHVFPHEIYFEWIICVATMFIVAAIDKTPIKQPEEVPED